MSSSPNNDPNKSNYKKLAQIETAISVDLSYEPKSFENLLNLNPNFDINYRIPETCFIKTNRSNMIATTLLDMTLDMLQTDMFKILIERGADLTNVNDDGCTVVHDSIGDDFEKQLGSKKFSGYIEDNGFAKIALDAHVDHDISNNPRNGYGFSHFHIACMTNRTRVVEYFLKNKTPVDEAIDKDSQALPGFTALHFAAKYASYETAEILLYYGADLNLKDQKGMTALHVIVEERLRTLPAVLKIKMKSNSPWDVKDIDEYFEENEKILKLFLKSASTSTDDIGFSKLQAACTLQDSSLVKQILSDSSVNLSDPVKSDSPIWPGYTALHFAAHFNYETFQLLLEKGANMEAQDIQGTSPFDICLLRFKVADIHSILSQDPKWQNILFSDGKTKLIDFIRAMQESSEFSSFLDNTVTNINMFIPLDSPICAGYSPLHLAVICSEKPPDYNESEDADYPTDRYESYHPTQKTLYGTRIQKCLDSGANVTAQDARGSSPLHWAFRLQEIALVRLLLDHHKQFTNPVDENGLSHLHLACACASEMMVMKLLLLNRADVNSRTKTNYSWYFGYSRTIARSGSTPLHFAIGCPKITEILLQCGADVLAADDEGFSPLKRVLDDQLNSYGSDKTEKRKILMLLIQRLTEVLGDSTDGPEKLLRCYKSLPFDFLMSILANDDGTRSEVWDEFGITSLHLACLKNDVDGVRMSLLQQGVDVDGRVRETSPMWSGLTPLYCYVVGRGLREDGSDDFSAVKLLLERGADVTMKIGGRTAVHKAFEILGHRQMPYELEVPIKDYKNDQNLVKLLLSYHKDFTSNPTTTSGLSHLHIACACNNVEVVEGLLKNGADVHQQIDYFCQKYGGNTPLHLAAIYKSKETVDILLKHGADVRATNSYDSTPLHVAAVTRFKDCRIMKALLNAGADANIENIIGATPLQLLLVYTSFTKNEVDVFLQNGFRVNAINPVTNEGCLAVALGRNQSFEFVYKMFVASADAKQLDEMNRNAIHNVVSHQRPNSDRVDYDVVEEHFIPVEDYTKAIEELVSFNLNIDQQDRQGKTPLHYAAKMQNLTAIMGLLDNGADFNIADESGKTAFVYSTEFTDTDYRVIDERILQIFVSHTYKLGLVNLHVDAFTKNLRRRIRKERSISVSNVEECLRELAMLRKARIKSSIQLNDFLCETGAVVNLSRSPLEERRVVDNLFKNTDLLRRQYPEFVGILILQYRKALARAELTALALVSLNVLFGFSMPLVCSDLVLKYLSNNSLKNLIAAAEEK